MLFDWNQFVGQCHEFRRNIISLGGSSPEILISEPASSVEIDEIECELGYPIPSSFREVLTNHSSQFHFEWERDHFSILPHPWKHVGDGRCMWSIQSLLALDSDLAKWRDDTYADPTNSYDKPWHGVFAAMATGLADGTSNATDWSGGDVWAINKSTSEVLFLSHDGDTENNGRRVANDFQDLLFRWSKIGFAGGGSGWGFGIFVDDSAGGFAPEGEPALHFRSLLGLAD